MKRNSLRRLVNCLKNIQILQRFLINKHLLRQYPDYIFRILLILHQFYFEHFLIIVVAVSSFPILLNLFLNLIHFTLDPIEVNLF